MLYLYIRCRGSLSGTDVATTEEAKLLRFRAEQANTFLKKYVQMQRDIAEGTFQLPERTRWIIHTAPFKDLGISTALSPPTAPTSNLSAARAYVEGDPMQDVNIDAQGYTEAQLADYVQGLRESVAVHVRPIPRPIYTGAQRNSAARRARNELADYILGESADGNYDVSYDKMKKGSMAVLLAPESEKTARTQYPFRICLGRSRGWSRYLYLCEVREQLTNDKGMFQVQPKSLVRRPWANSCLKPYF